MKQRKRQKLKTKRIAGVLHYLTKCEVCGQESWTQAGRTRVPSRYRCDTCEPLIPYRKINGLPL